MATLLLPAGPELVEAPTGLATVQIVRSPLRGADGQLRMLQQTVPAGQMVHESLPPNITCARAILNGLVLTETEYATTNLQPGDELTILPEWGDPFFTPTVLATIAVGLIVSVAATALTYVLFPPDKPHIKAGERDEPTFSFEGIRTTVGPGAVVPVVYGRFRVGGQLLSASVDQAMTVIDAPSPVGGAVPHPIDNVYGGTLSPNGVPLTPITVVANNHGAIVGSHVDIGGVTGKTGANGGWFISRVHDVHTVDLQGSEGVDPRPYTGGGVLVVVDNTTPGPRRVAATSTPPTLTLLLGLTEGPYGGLLPETIELNGQPIGNFPGVQIFQSIGTPDQTPLPTFGEIANTFGDGREIPALPGIAYTTTVAVEGFTLNIVFQDGLYHFNPKGEKEENVSTLGYRYRSRPAGAWSAFSYFDVASARTAPVRFGIRREHLPQAVYDIELAWSHAFQVVPDRSKWVPTLESVTELRHNTNAYPNTALLGLRTLATDALQGALPNVSVEILGRTVRVNEFLYNNNWTDNPAWVVMDLMTNTRYGMGIPDAEIDLPGLCRLGRLL